jgi:hypothetical protein
MCALKPAFTATSLESLMVKIRKGQREQRISMSYSEDLRSLIGRLLNVDSKSRPSARDLLLMPLFQKFINESPATLYGSYEAPSGNTPRLDSRHVARAPHLSVQPASAKPQNRADILVIDDSPKPGRKDAHRSHLKPEKGRIVRAGSLNDIDKLPNSALPVLSRGDSEPDLTADDLSPAQLKRIGAELRDATKPQALRPLQHPAVRRSDSEKFDRGTSPLGRRPSLNADRNPQIQISPSNHAPSPGLPKQPSPLSMHPPNIQSPSLHGEKRLSLQYGGAHLLPAQPSLSAQNSPQMGRKHRSNGQLDPFPGELKRATTPQFAEQLSQYRAADGVHVENGNLRKYNSMQVCLCIIMIVLLLDIFS